MTTIKMLVRVQRCRYCRREMNVVPLSYKENPFCNVCLDERREAARIERGPVEWVEEGRYVTLKPRGSRTTSSGS